MEGNIETLLVPLLDALSGCQTLKKLTLLRETFDAIAAPALVRALPHLRGLDKIKVEQDRCTPSYLASATAIVLRAALDGKVSQITCLEMNEFDLRTIDSEIWGLLSSNHTLNELQMYGLPYPWVSCVGPKEQHRPPTIDSLGSYQQRRIRRVCGSTGSQCVP